MRSLVLRQPPLPRRERIKVRGVIPILPFPLQGARRATSRANRDGALALVILLVVSLTTPGLAQPLSAGGGPIIGWLSLELTELNESLARAGLPQLGPGVVLTGVSYFGERRDGFDLGGLMAFGQSGATRLDKSVRLSLLFGGPTLEYGELVSEQLGVFVGGLVALVHLAFAITLHPAEGFDSGLRKPSGTSLARSFFLMELYAGGEWALGEGRFRLSLGYLWAGATTNWKADGRDFPGPIGAFRGPLVQMVFIFGI